MMLDAKVVFYLKHQRQIDEWSNLRTRVTASAHEFFCSLASDVESLTRELSGDARSVTYFEDTFPSISLYRQNWCDETSEYPFTSVTLYWNRKSGSFTDAYCGVWIDYERKAYEKFKPILFEAIKKVISKGKFVDSYSSELAVYRVEKPKMENYWEDLDGFKAQLLSSFREQWDLFWKAIDDAVQQFQNAK